MLNVSSTELSEVLISGSPWNKINSNLGARLFELIIRRFLTRAKPLTHLPLTTWGRVLTAKPGSWWSSVLIAPKYEIRPVPTIPHVRIFKSTTSEETTSNLSSRASFSPPSPYSGWRPTPSQLSSFLGMKIARSLNKYHQHIKRVDLFPRPKMRSPFHTLLVYLSVFDFVYLLMSQAIFGFPSISQPYQHSVYPMILPICKYYRAGQKSGP